MKWERRTVADLLERLLGRDKAETIAARERPADAVSSHEPFLRMERSVRPGDGLNPRRAINRRRRALRSTVRRRRAHGRQT